MRRLQSSVLLAMALLALAACHQAPTAKQPTEPKAGATASVGSVDFLAAAEPFEALTESAFNSDAAALETAIAAAQASWQNAAKALPRPARSEGERDMATIASARQADDRAGIALASIDVYRQLVQSAPATAVPLQVSLLDYAGFHYDADLKARPARWVDAADAATFAKSQWDAIAPRVIDQSLSDRVTKAIADMATVASSQNASRAAAVAKAELDLVDLLETYFTKKPA